MTARSIPRLFGTDGVRGRFGEPPLDRTTVTRLARALAAVLKEEAGERSPMVVLGGDTRASTPRLAGWLTTVLEVEGIVCRSCGVVPTPAVARLVGQWGADAGIVLSASHNPHHDNGIKLLDPQGFKWSEAAEAALEGRMAVLPDESPEGGDPLETESPAPDPRAAEAYLDALVNLLERQEGKAPLQRLNLALDAANGAASPYARGLFERLGATVEILHAAPDGRNINAGCGSTAPEDLARAVAAGGHSLGFAFDGDADRAILVDEEGTVRDGDALLYLWATDLAERGEGLKKIVATVMSNLGLEVALRQQGIEMVRCPVGDRQVVETLQREGLHLGGEQSGHIVHLALSTTGDGLLTALQIAAGVARRGRPVGELLAPFERFPQVLINVPVARRESFDSIPPIAEEVRAVESRLDGNGRLLLRYSGTEPLARVMMEGPDQGEIQALAEGLAEVIREELGA